MRTEILLSIVFLTGLSLWLSNSFIYSAELTGGGLLLIAFLYFPFGFYFFRVDGKHHIVYSLIAGLILFMAPFSLLLSLLSLPGAVMQAGIGLCVLPLLLLITVFIRRRSSPALKKYYRHSLIRIVVWLVIVIFIFFSPPETPRF